INDVGEVVGYAYAADGAGHAFLYSDGMMVDLGSFGGSIAAAWDINASGQVAGEAQTTHPGESHAFLWNPDVPNGTTGTLNDLGTFGGFPTSTAYAINDAGQAAGTSGGHAILFSDGMLIDLGFLPGGFNSSATGINALGQVAGISTTTVGGPATHAFLYSTGTMFDLGTLPGSLSSAAFSINASGQVVGVSNFFDGGLSSHGFLWTPDVP